MLIIFFFDANGMTSPLAGVYSPHWIAGGDTSDVDESEPGWDRIEWNAHGSYRGALRALLWSIRANRVSLLSRSSVAKFPQRKGIAPRATRVQAELSQGDTA